LNSDGNRGGHPDVSDEDIGRRTVEIRRERALERAIELIRKKLGPEWADLTTRDVERLHWALGEVWGHMARSGWDSLSFSALSIYDVRAVLDMSEQLSAAKFGTSRILERMVDVLKNPGQHEPVEEDEEADDEA
jgi:hypothetical protein